MEKPNSVPAVLFKKAKVLLGDISNNLVLATSILLALSFVLVALFLQFTPGYQGWLIVVFFLIVSVFLAFASAYNSLLNQSDREKDNNFKKDESLSFIAHELNAPLGNIKGAIAVVASEEAGKLSPANIKLLERTTQSVDQLIKLVNNLLLISRYDQGRMEILPRTCALEEIVQPVVENYIPLAAEKGLTLVYHKAEEPLPKLYIDPDRIREVVENLLSNSIKYTQKGSVTVNIESSHKGVTVSIKDTGLGIPKGKLNRLFQRFSRLKNNLSAKGTGLGLFISRLIIEAHRGKIWVESTEGVGSTFLFSLPLPTKAAVGKV